MKRESPFPASTGPARSRTSGFHFHTIDGVYWDERACYRFTAAEVDKLELATGELQSRCIDAATRVIESGDYGRFQIPEAFIPLIEQSWNDDEKSLYGRFDLSCDGAASRSCWSTTPTRRPRCSRRASCSGTGCKDVFPSHDQFNSIHERLIERWKQMAQDCPADRIVHFACVADSVEDFRHRRLPARHAPCRPASTRARIDIADIGWDGQRCFTRPGRACRSPCSSSSIRGSGSSREEFGAEPARRAVPLDRAAVEDAAVEQGDPAGALGDVPGPPEPAAGVLRAGEVRDGLREEADLFPRGRQRLHHRRRRARSRSPATTARRASSGRATTSCRAFGGNYTVIGSWIVGEEPAGIGMREDATPITNNTSRFVPHHFT